MDSKASSAEAHVERPDNPNSTPSRDDGKDDFGCDVKEVDDARRFKLENLVDGRRHKQYRQRARTSLDGLEKAFGSWYQKWIIERLLRQHPLPASEDGRHIPLCVGRRAPLLDERRARPYVSNFIRSNRYTIWTFLPKQLYFQFSKLGNLYFLTISMMQLIPGLSPTGRFTTIAPLSIFVTISMAKEGVDDYRRYELDKLENRCGVWVLGPSEIASKPAFGRSIMRSHARSERKLNVQGDNSSTLELGRSTSSPGEADAWSRTQWQNLKVGDVIRLERDDDVPADIVLLQASGTDGVAYIETMALDGETNLKSKQACPLLAEHWESGHLKGSDAVVVSEDPNLDLYNYDGRVTVGGETMPLTMNNVVYRGSTLRNTASATGLVLNTGEECKIRMNSQRHLHAKAPAMQALVNRIIFLLIVFVLLVSFGLTVANRLWENHNIPKAWYVRHFRMRLVRVVVGFIIMFNSLVPLSLYVSLEIVKIGQYFLMQDDEMYDRETNTPMVANTTTILENLGQVTHVFSDKTGTLTENKMRFRKISVAGTAWTHHDDVEKDDGTEMGTSQTSLLGAEDRNSQVTIEPTTKALLSYIQQNPNTEFSKEAQHFLLCIAICHTCLPEKKGNGEVGFQAASPDELALVQAAQELGYLLINRSSQSMVLRRRTPEGQSVEDTYQILDVIEFSSGRKRMSIVVRMPDGRICIISKGADSALLPRLRLSKLARERAAKIERKLSVRKTLEVSRALNRMGAQPATPRSSMGSRRPASASSRLSQISNEMYNQSDIPEEFRMWMSRAGKESDSLSLSRRDSGQSALGDSIMPSMVTRGYFDELVATAADHGATFERCFQHVNEFAAQGLRTLLYGYRYLDDTDYASWKQLYHDASTSLVDRQKRMEDVGEMIEKDLELAGATAIEDKLQSGVPETIDKLRRANIKVWMLTGDKRETAINIANSARLCKPFSDIYVIDAAADHLREKMTDALLDVVRGTIAHSVVVVDGHTLSVIEEKESLKLLFFDLATRVDSVIFCRASPSQKATLVKCVRDTVPSALTLAIGDGANDIAMIQASHVGIGISGREGLQAARVSDYSIAQFRFLQRLLFVHGRWNYIRTCKYILGTFWKEIFFYMAQAYYQASTGYTGLSLYENWSLTVFNTLFTSLTVIIPGIFEKDLSAATLLAVPELYTYGQRNEGFNFRKYMGWMIMGLVDSAIVFVITWSIFRKVSFSSDNTTYAFGQAIFIVNVVFINIKLLVLEMHHKTWLSLLGLAAMIGGVFAWNLFLAGAHVVRPVPAPYQVNQGFLRNYGAQLGWWAMCLVALAAVLAFELGVAAVRRVCWPRDQDLWQEREAQRPSRGRGKKGGGGARGVWYGEEEVEGRYGGSYEMKRWKGNMV